MSPEILMTLMKIILTIHKGKKVKFFPLQDLEALRVVRG
jgi:hypothetical protein